MGIQRGFFGNFTEQKTRSAEPVFTGLRDLPVEQNRLGAMPNKRRKK
jgi:hypothetical protein